MTAILPFLAAMLFSGAALALEKQPVNAGPYVPSPQSVVSDMLTLAKVGPSDFVIDLGSGDGRIVRTAAKYFGARGFGVDINEKLVREANDSAKREGIADRVKFVTQDLFKTDISRATVLTMYLLPDTVNLLKDKLLTELKPGTRILSHDYPLSGWLPEDYRQFDLDDKVAITGVSTTLIYMYVVPAKAHGTWTVRLPAGLSKDSVRMELKQQITRVAGNAHIGGSDVLLEEGKVRGEQISFKLALAGKTYAFTGTMRTGSIDGMVEIGGVRSPWSAIPAR